MLARNEEAFDPEAFQSAQPAGKTKLTFRANSEIYAQGSPADAVYFITKGVVKHTTVTESRKEAVLTILGPGNFFGDGCLTALKQRKVTVTALEETSVFRREAAAMKRLLHENPQFSEYYIAYLIDRKIRTEFSLIEQLVYSSEQRLARALLQLTDAGAKGAPRTVGIKISQNTLADVGTTRSRVSFFLNKFRRLGFIESKDCKADLRVHRSLLSTALGYLP